MKNVKEQDMDLENVRQQLVSSIQTKADFRDIDSLAQKFHMKLDTDKAQAMLSDMRQEIQTTLGQIRKDGTQSTKKKDEEYSRFRNDFENVQMKNIQEINSL